MARRCGRAELKSSVFPRDMQSLLALSVICDNVDAFSCVIVSAGRLCAAVAVSVMWQDLVSVMAVSFGARKHCLSATCAEGRCSTNQLPFHLEQTVPLCQFFPITAPAVHRNVTFRLRAGSYTDNRNSTTLPADVSIVRQIDLCFRYLPPQLSASQAVLKKSSVDQN